ncbi:hypothetical protein MYXO_00958 [Myxococcaceae bacterium]|nr:hypothetical protein MYXO_00958 [Myxococcaceae bacterium]
MASLYPSDVAALVVFDIWIGNWDRGGNIKAAVVSEHLPLFLAFDHSHALLNVDETAGGSIARLGGGSLIVESHPFYGRATPDMLDKWVERIARMDAGTVAECCGFGRPFRSVGTETQEALGIALAARAGDLPRIVSENKAKIQVQGHHGNR